MAPFDDWNALDDGVDEELDNTFDSQGRDILLFCIDASESMIRIRDIGGHKKSSLQAVLDIAVQLQKRKVITSPNDLVGIMFYNTGEKSERGRGAEIKKHCYVYQNIAQINAESIQQLSALTYEIEKHPEKAEEIFPPNKGRTPIGDVFTSCNWLFRDGAPKTGLKRIFLVTDEDDPHPSSPQFIKTAQTTFDDLSASGVIITPFFIQRTGRAFDRSKFWDHVLPREDTDEDNVGEQRPDIITELESLVQEMKIRELPKRTIFSVALHLADDFSIGVKGYGLVTQQSKPTYKYFTTGRTMEEARSKTVYYDALFQKEYDKSRIVFGMTLGSTGEAGDEDGKNVAHAGIKHRVFFTADDIKSFRTLDLEPGLRLLGFKDKSELAFEDNIKHSIFIYPDEAAFSGSVRTFSALLKTLLAKDKIGLVMGITRRNSAPMFYALLPQAEVVGDDGSQLDPPGFHLQPLPYADDIRAAPIEEARKANDELTRAARTWVDRLTIKNGSYQPDNYPNPALALFWGQLEARAFQEKYDPEQFSDLSAPRYEPMHKRAGDLMKKWKEVLKEDEAVYEVKIVSGTKRKAEADAEDTESMRSKSRAGTLGRLKVDQLKNFLRIKGQSTSGKKAELVERVEEWFQNH